MSGLLIVGAGGHGKVVAEAAIAVGRWNRLAFADDSFGSLPMWNRIPIVGPAEPDERLFGEYSEVVVAIGDAEVRLRLLKEYEKSGYRIATIRHPSAVISPTAECGQGTVCLPGAIVNADAFLGIGCILNSNASVDHDCSLGKGVHICPGAAVGGGVHIGDRAWIGIGASVVQGIRIGSDVIVGAGAAVVSDLPDNVTALGVPARATGN
jgi:sugar O-acyltransferase (sialic acid O-acetyltransferase NeuD family)